MKAYPISFSIFCFLFTFQVALSVKASEIRVAKDGSGTFSSIQSAINAARAGDVITIMDTEIYDEQISFDSTKSGITLRSSNPEAFKKPVIRWLEPGSSDYIRINGALRIIGCHDIIIDGVSIDGVKPLSLIVENKFRDSISYGNSAVNIIQSGKSIIRNCEITNAYFGISILDYNPRGIYFQLNGDPLPPQFEEDLSTGNLVIEKNRIHDNSWGIYIGENTNLGSVIRFNLIYNNYHRSEILNNVQSRLNDQAGGAFIFDRTPFTPYIIHNNTLHNNYLLFSAGFRAGAQHLIFNNIFSSPVKFWSEGYENGSFKNPESEISRRFVNRMKNCVFSAQQNETEAGADGSPVANFPNDSKVRWFQTPFLSLDSSSPDFLVPDWSNAGVVSNIKNQGWSESGIVNRDGLPTDIGAIQSGQLPIERASIKPDSAAIIYKGKAYLDFTLNSSINLSEIKIRSFRFIDRSYIPLFPYDASLVLADSSIKEIPVNLINISEGKNRLQVALPFDISPEYGFFEITMEGKGTDGSPVLFEVGHIPCWWAEGKLHINFLDLTTKAPISEVKAGQQVLIEITPTLKGIGLFNDSIDVEADFLSGSKTYNFSLKGKLTDTIAFTRVRQNENLFFYRKLAINYTKFYGETKITVLPNEATQTGLLPEPHTNMHVAFSGPITMPLLDQFGNAVSKGNSVRIVCLDSTIAKVKESELVSDSTGNASFELLPTGGGANISDTVRIAVSFKSGYSDTLQFVLYYSKSPISLKPIHKIKSDNQFLVEVISLNGQVIKRIKSTSAQPHAIYLSRQSFGRGTYLVKTTNLKTKEVKMNKLVSIMR